MRQAEQLPLGELSWLLFFCFMFTLGEQQLSLFIVFLEDMQDVFERSLTSADQEHFLFLKVAELDVKQSALGLVCRVQAVNGFLERGELIRGAKKS